ncbi:aldehyde dehydrogenase family protein [Knoellia sp. CPCC 206435]|uniref:aldehyde dehydrogenase family protein n=1 Tax=Knoellia terrae TaxID=3404797 RepID=UPI003B42C5EF
MSEQLLSGSRWSGRYFSNGWQVSGSQGAVTDKATGELLESTGLADADAVSHAVETALAAQRAWSALAYDARAVVLRRAGALFEEHAAEAAEWTARESGAPLAMAERAQSVAAQECYEAAGLASAPYGELLRSGAPRLSLARRRPVGVVGVIAPFNAPLVLAIRAVAPALALGNAVVLKPDPRTAVSGGVLIARIFEEAGLPAGLLHVLPGGAEVGQAVVEHPRVPVIAFTGSTGAGRAIALAAAARFKRVHLELGGNSALVVLHDADVAKAAAAGAFGSFRHAGQICMASGRHLVHESLVDDYLAELTRIAEATVVGDPLGPGVGYGPLIDSGQRDRVHTLVTASVGAGADLLAGGTYDGLFYRPTVLGHTPLDAPAYASEVFGPVAPVVSFADSDEAASLAADSPYGLSLGIITRDVMAGLDLADRVSTGSVHINDQTINDEPTAPFGGLGESGSGGKHGGVQSNLEAFTELQWVTVRRDLPAYPS